MNLGQTLENRNWSFKGWHGRSILRQSSLPRIVQAGSDAVHGGADRIVDRLVEG
jgi:hypothetical protein